MPRIPAGFVSCLLVFNLAAGVSATAAAPLFDLGDKGVVDRVALSDANAEAVQVDGTTALRVVFGTRMPYPNIRFVPDRIGFPANWSSASALAVTVENTGTAPLPLGVRIDSGAARDRGRQATSALPPGRRVRLVMPVAKTAAIVGMIGQPPQATGRPGDVSLAPANTPFDPAAITSVQLFVAKPADRQTVVVRRIELLEASAPQVPFVDRFGQYNGANWPGKLQQEPEFAVRREAEDARLAELGPLPDRNGYGGWAAGPRLEATGRFRVQKHAGRWWLVDPDGRLFWSSGITCFRFNNTTRVAGRENFYEWLPRAGEPLARFYSGSGEARAFDFYAANLFRKYGPEYESAFFDRGTRRLVSWGVNTIANWSDPRAWTMRRVPYTVPVSSSGGSTFVVAERLKAGRPWVRRFPDPFDPRFAAALDEKLAALAHLKDDPWLLGVFVDNELPWAEGVPPRSVAAAALDTPAGAPIKTALLADLRAAYPTIGDVNAAFGTRWPSWDEAGGAWRLSGSQLQSAAGPLGRLDALIAGQYFRTCRDAVRRHLPGHLYLGSRFHVYNREAIRAARQYCDVVSFNIYAYRPSERPADEFATEMDFPVMIGEFHFGATDRGMFHPGLRAAENQADRAAKYVAYLSEAARAPWCVGAHWFQYLDQALTGRGDGENYNIGFVNATDDAYPELSDAARRFHATLYRTRAESRLP